MGYAALPKLHQPFSLGRGGGKVDRNQGVERSGAAGRTLTGQPAAGWCALPLVRRQELLNRVQLQNQRHYEEMNSKYNKDRHHKQDKQQQQQGKDGAAQPGEGGAAPGGAKGGKPAAEQDGSGKQQQQQQQQPAPAGAGAGADGPATAGAGEAAATPAAAAAAANGDASQQPQPVCIYRRRRHHASDATSAQRDTQVELINVMLEALEQEHEVLYQMLLVPIQSFILEVLPEDARETTKVRSGAGRSRCAALASLWAWLGPPPGLARAAAALVEQGQTAGQRADRGGQGGRWADWIVGAAPVVPQMELAYEDFEKLMPEDALSIVEWLTEKVDSLTTRLKAEPKEEEEVRRSRGGGAAEAARGQGTQPRPRPVVASTRPVGARASVGGMTGRAGE